MMQQGVDERPVEIAGGGVHYQTGGLVDDEQVLILERDVQRNVLRFVVRRRRFRHCDAQGLFSANLCRRIADRLSLSLDGAGAN